MSYGHQAYLHEDEDVNCIKSNKFTVLQYIALWMMNERGITPSSLSIPCNKTFNFFKTRIAMALILSVFQFISVFYIALMMLRT